MNGGIMERERSREPVERLQLLDRVAFDPGTESLTYDRVEIHEALASEELVELLSACCVAAHQTLESRRLVVAEVVDVRAGIRGERLHDAIDGGLERGTLVSVCKRPETLILPRRGGRTRRTAPQPEQILAAAFAGEPRALQIEEQVHWRWIGQSGEALPFDNRQ